MDYVYWAGIIFGGLLILAVIYIAVIRKDFPKGAFIFLGFAVVLIAGSKWAVIKVSMESIELLRDQVQETAAAADEVAAQAQQTATVVQTTQTEVANLTSLLERRQVLSPEATRGIRQRFDATPRIDLTKLNKARATLARIRAP